MSPKQNDNADNDNANVEPAAQTPTSPTSTNPTSTNPTSTSPTSTSPTSTSQTPSSQTSSSQTSSSQPSTNPTSTSQTPTSQTPTNRVPPSAASLRFASRLLSASNRSSHNEPLIVAEISTNHRGSLSEACALVAAAARTGADAVKIQSYSACDLTIESERSEFTLSHPLWRGRKLYDLYRQGGLPFSWHESLWRTASDHDIAIFPSVFSCARLSELEFFSPPAYKIASGELVDLPLIGSVARTNRGMIISTGMGNLDEISRAVSTVRATSGSSLLLLHCLSAYPAPPDCMNLRAISTLSRAFSCGIGLSDHTRDNRAALMSVALGACLIEKHFTLERRADDLDASFSLDEAEFADFVLSIRGAWRSMGSGALEASEAERASLSFRRSLYVVRSVERGERFSEENIRSIRPNAGLSPQHFTRVLSSRAAFAIGAGEPLREDMLASGSPTSTLQPADLSSSETKTFGEASILSKACARSEDFRRRSLERVSGDSTNDNLGTRNLSDHLGTRSSGVGTSSDMSSCLAIIPARGGSKRIRDKNIVDFFGKPLLSYTLSYSLELVGSSGIFSRAHVSTDSERIAEVARDCGFTLDFMRDALLADDFTGVWDVVRWVLEEYQRRGERFDSVCLLYAGTPLLDGLDLRGGMEYFLSLGRGYHVMACCEYLSSPLRALSLDGEGNISAIDEGSFSVSRSQDLGTYVMDCGAFSYRWTEDVLDGVEALAESRTRAYILDRTKGVDINTERDLEFAKLLYRARELD